MLFSVISFYRGESTNLIDFVSQANDHIYSKLPTFHMFAVLNIVN